MHKTPFLSADLNLDIHNPQWLIDTKEQYQDVLHLEFKSLDLDPRIAMVLSDVQVLSQRYTLPPTYSSLLEAALVLTHLCRQLHHSLSQPLINPSSPLVSVVSEACQHAIAIHVFSPWQGQHLDPTLVVNKLLHNLKASLQQLLISSMN
jgi:hypothetical protein